MAIAAEFGLMSGSNSSSLLHIANETEYDGSVPCVAVVDVCHIAWNELHLVA